MNRLYSGINRHNQVALRIYFLQCPSKILVEDRIRDLLVTICNKVTCNKVRVTRNRKLKINILTISNLSSENNNSVKSSRHKCQCRKLLGYCKIFTSNHLMELVLAIWSNENQHVKMDVSPGNTKTIYLFVFCKKNMTKVREMSMEYRSYSFPFLDRGMNCFWAKSWNISFNNLKEMRRLCA